MRLLKKIHIYLGLLSFSIVLVWGIVGLYAMLAGGEEGVPEVRREWTVPFPVAANSTDRAVADAVYALLKPSLASPLPNYALQHDPDGRLRLDFYSVNGVVRVLVRENEGSLLVQERRNDFVRFLSAIHSATQGGDNPHWQMRVWTAYTEFSIWSLLSMSLTGCLMWCTSRPRYAAAWVSGAIGLIVFGVLYGMVR